jgi:Ser/Thr protein kinase RdoA (MazF antagonist)
MNRAWTAEDALVAAQQALVVLGIGGQRLQLLRLGENALYRILGTDLLLRVARAGTKSHDVARTIAAATTLRANGVPVCEPADRGSPDGPMVFDNGVVSVWKYYAELPGASTDFTGFGRALRSLHVKSTELAGMLPRWDPLGMTRARLRAVSRIGVPPQWIQDLTRRVDHFEHELATFEPVLSDGVIHGDAHVGNVLDAGGGPILIDLDNLSNGPRDADFAPTIVQLRRFGLATEHWIEFITGYGLHDPWILHDSPLVRLRELFMLAWLLQQFGSNGAVDQEIELRMGSLDDRVDSPTRWNAR